MSKRKNRSENAVNEAIVNDIPAEEVRQSEANELEVVEPEKVEDDESSVEVLLGVVTNCKMLNIREEATKDSVIVTMADNGESVTIYPDKSTEGWYRVSTKDNVEGYCMKDYISIQ